MNKYQEYFNFKFEFVFMLKDINEINFNKSLRGPISLELLELPKRKFNSPNFFPDELKNTDIVPVYKEDVNGKNNYQQISLLPIISKIFGNIF